MLSHSTFSSSAHLGGGLAHDGLHQSRLGQAAEPAGPLLHGPVAHHVSVTWVNKPLSNTLF